MHVKPIRVGLGHDPAEIIVADSERRTGRSEQRQIGLTIVTDSVDIVARAVEKKSVARAIIVLDAALSVGVPRVIKPTALVIRSKGVSWVQRPGAIRVSQSGLSAVRVREPAVEMIERAIFH